jgi:Flp pilus assembly protein TadB
VTHWLPVIGLALWAGFALLLAEQRWFRRTPLLERLRPFTSGRVDPTSSHAGVLSITSFREVIAPVAQVIGAVLSRVLGVSEEPGLRLRRIHAPLDVTDFRLRQVGWSGAAFACAAVVAQAVPLPPAVVLLLLVGAPLLAFLVLEQQLANASARWQRHLFLELPVVSEQLGMLLSAGYSLGGALNRMAARGEGACSRDLKMVCTRIRHGLSELDALREWADRAGVDALDRLVHVLALNQETGDLGRLISEEARTLRRDAQRELIETIERRGQQVWIPVTVATLVPGVLFLAVPFIEAMRLFSGGP